LKTNPKVTGGASGLNLGTIDAGDTNKRTTILKKINDYYSTNYVALGTQLGAAIGSAVAGNYLPLITLPSKLGFEVFEQSEAGEKVNTALSGIRLITKLKTLAGSLDFESGPSLLQSLVSTSNVRQMVGVVNDYNEIMTDLGGPTVTALASGSTVQNVKDALAAVQANMAASGQSDTYSALVSYLSTAVDDLDEATHTLNDILDQLKVAQKYEAADDADSPALEAQLKGKASDEQELMAMWMHVRDMLDYLPLALDKFGTADDEDVAPKCRAYVTMGSPFMLAVNAKDFIRSCPDSRTCMKMDRTCGFINDAVCSKKDKDRECACIIA